MSDPKSTRSDLKRTRGDTYADEVQVTSITTKSPVNIKDYTFVLTLDLSESPMTDVNNLYVLQGEIINAAAGLVEFAPTAEQTNRVGTFYYDIQMIDTKGRIRTIDYGVYTFAQDISK
jgi:hypothetical protein